MPSEQSEELVCRYCGSEVEVRTRFGGDPILWTCPEHDLVSESETEMEA